MFGKYLVILVLHPTWLGRAYLSSFEERFFFVTVIKVLEKEHVEHQYVMFSLYINVPSEAP